MLARFLTGNRNLVTATQAGIHANICTQLMRSIWLAIQKKMWRIRTIALRSDAAVALPNEERKTQGRAQLRQAVWGLGLLQPN